MSQDDRLEPHILKRFQCVQKIGNGAYGIVWKVMDRQTGKFYALKKNFNAFQNSTDAQKSFRQIMYLKQLEHPNIVQMIEVIGSINEKDIYILFEYLDIDLYALIKRENIMEERHKRFIIYQIAKALYYLHSAQLIHRDIKPSNVLINEDCHAKICDFGFVRSVYQEEEQNQPILTQYITSRWYRAPQILLGSKRYSKPSDVWSFGCMVGQIMTGKAMFPGNSTLNQIEKVATWTGSPNNIDLKSLQTNFGKQMIDILNKVKQKNRKDWFVNLPQDGLDLISKTLVFNPEKRLTMLDVLKHPFVKQFYSKKEIIFAKQPMIINVQDNKKLSLKQYRSLIYNLVRDFQKNNQVGSEIIQHSQASGVTQSKILRKNRLIKKVARRSQSKKKEKSNPKNTQIKTASIKRKYETRNSRAKEKTTKNKYARTEQIEEEKNNRYPKRKRSQNLVNILTQSSDKKKKSGSLYQKRKNSKVLGKYMYQHRKI